jgi:DNA-binding MarR family transcriptional regulator
LLVIVHQVQATATLSSEVTRSQLVTLRYLVEHGSSTMLDLAAGVGVTPPTMTGTVKVLLRKGLIARRHGDEDWRTVLVEATEAGVLAQDQARDARIRVLARAIAELTPEQRALLTLSAGSLDVLARRLSGS